MENLNAEQIKKALECHISGKLTNCEHCPFDKAHLFNSTCVQAMCENALALITSQEQRIKELDEESKKWEQAYDCMDSACRELSDKCDRLTEENERLHTSCTELTRKCEMLHEENKRVHQAYYEIACEVEDLRAKNDRLQKAQNADISIVRVCRGSGKTNHLREVARIRMDAVRADTVRKMHHKIWLEFSDCTEEEKVSVGSFRESVDQIAKEMLGSIECENKGEEICKVQKK